MAANRSQPSGCRAITTTPTPRGRRRCNACRRVPKGRHPSSTPPPTASSVDRYNATLPAPPDTYPARPQSSVTGKNYSFQYDDHSPGGGPALNPPSPNSVAGDNAAIPSTLSAAPTGMPLHERLKVFRESPFGDTAQATPSPLNSPAPAEPAARDATAEHGEYVNHAPTPAVRSPDTLPSPPADAEPQHPATAKPGKDAGVAGQGPQPPDVEHPATGNSTNDAGVARQGTQLPDVQHPATAKPADDAAQEPSVLIDHKSPLLSVETIGPRKIVVGKEAAYEVLLQNSGDVAAEEVTVTVGLPDWAEVAGASASSGEVHPIAARPSRSLPLGAGSDRSPLEREARPEDHSAGRASRSSWPFAGTSSSRRRRP